MRASILLSLVVLPGGEFAAAFGQQPSWSVIGTLAEPFAWSAAAGSCLSGAPNWTINPSQFESNASITAAVTVDGSGTSNPDNLLAALVDGDVRGVASATDVNGSPVFFLTAYANSNGETMTFQFYDADTDQVYGTSYTLVFSANAIVGSPSSPIELDATCAALTTGVSEEIPEKQDGLRGPELFQNYPNPFTGSTTMSYRIQQSAVVRLVVADLTGREVAILVHGHKTAGTYSVTYDAGSLPNGMYAFRLEADGVRRIGKMILVRK